MIKLVLTAAAAALIAMPAFAQITVSPGTGAASTTGTSSPPGGVAAPSAPVSPPVSGVGATSPLTETSTGPQTTGSSAAVVRIPVLKVGQEVSDRDGVSLGVIERIYTVRGKKRLALRSEERKAWILASTMLSTSTAGLVSTKSRAEVYGRKR